MASNSTIKQSSHSIKDLQCEQVVVFTDRAEVKRSLKVNLKKGENELVLTNVSSFVDRDSFRVTGEGDATVLDVVCLEKRVDRNSSNEHEKIKELRNEIEALEKTLKQLNAKQTIFEKKQAYLNEFTNSLAKTSSSSDHQKDGRNNTVVIGSMKENSAEFLQFLDSYAEKSDTIDQAKFELSAEVEKITNQLSIARDNLNKIYNGAYEETVEVTVLLEAKADDTNVNLHISYLVYNASWTPKYDIRVSSRDNVMIINYYGMITQSTGEDWNDAKLSLSTATPSIGGNVPELETTNVRIKRPPPPPPPMPKMSMMKRSLAGGFGNSAQMEMDFQPMAMAAPMMQFAVMEARVETASVGSTSTFIIPRNATIPSDNNTHKVTIGVIELKPQFEYETVPKKNSNVYIKAKSTNTSQYALLAGQASVFFENNFVAKTNLKPCSPTEELACSLGVDPGIRVEYKPIKKFAAQVGLISKSTSTAYTQSIEIKNTTLKKIRLLLIDTLPLSNDDKIQVKLLEPNVKNTPNVKINKSNNLEFELDIDAGKTEEIYVKYAVDHPADQEIEFF